MPREVVWFVLRDEIEAGRVVHERDGFRIVEERFAPDVLIGLRAIASFDPDHSRPARRSGHLEARPVGELATLGVASRDDRPWGDPAPLGVAGAGRRAKSTS